jgi:cell fate regulator YaaT (PSP1 superfamily)
MQTVEVRFKGNRKGFFSWGDEAEPLRLSEPVIVEAERGLDFGRINSIGDTAEKKCTSCSTGCATGEGAAEAPVVRPVNRRASQEEIKSANELRKSEEDVRRKVIERVKEHQLQMKVSDAEWQWDRNKLTIYFTAEKRVDFRALVRDLASQFRTRIELRQIGVRDEAARLTGVGRCGREYCCSTWLTELSPVNLSLAKDQHLSLNPQQISGGCGRLLCCLKYEHDFYVASRKRFPKEGKTLRTAIGPEKVIAVDIFRERVFLRHDEAGPRIISLVQLKEELELSGEPLPTIEIKPVREPPREKPSEPAAPVQTQGDSQQPSGKSRRRRRGRRGRGGGGNGGSGTGPGPTPSQN